jgi:hypothetical protein
VAGVVYGTGAVVEGAADILGVNQPSTPSTTSTPTLKPAPVVETPLTRSEKVVMKTQNKRDEGLEIETLTIGKKSGLYIKNNISNSSICKLEEEGEISRELSAKWRAPKTLDNPAGQSRLKYWYEGAKPGLAGFVGGDRHASKEKCISNLKSAVHDVLDIALKTKAVVSGVGGGGGGGPAIVPPTSTVQSPPVLTPVVIPSSPAPLPPVMTPPQAVDSWVWYATEGLNHLYPYFGTAIKKVGEQAKIEHERLFEDAKARGLTDDQASAEVAAYDRRV